GWLPARAGVQRGREQQLVDQARLYLALLGCLQALAIALIVRAVRIHARGKEQVVARLELDDVLGTWRRSEPRRPDHAVGLGRNRGELSRLAAVQRKNP